MLTDPSRSGQQHEHEEGRTEQNLWMYGLSEFLGAGVVAVFFLLLKREKPHEASVASRDIAQDETNQSIRAM